MATLNETPSANRIRIAFFGLRNAGKSTLVNAFTGQHIAIVSDVAGTTTDPVSKAMEILPLGPCLVTDTAGLDDEGDLGALRVAKSLAVLATTDIAVWVEGASAGAGASAGRARSPSEPQGSTGRSVSGPYQDTCTRNQHPPSIKSRFLAECAKRNVTVLTYHRGDSVEELKRRIAALHLAEQPKGLLEGLVGKGDRVVCVCPIDESAPKGRLILPQVQVIRECLDRGAWCAVCQPAELPAVLASGAWQWVVTDSQAFGEVCICLKSGKDESKVSVAQMESRADAPRLTSFSILFARQKGDLAAYARGVEAIARLKDGDTVLIAEGCTHHRQCNDIGTVKLPKALRKLSGRNLNFVFSSGADFPLTGSDGQMVKSSDGQMVPVNNHPTIRPSDRPTLIVQCGGCMLTRREVMRRIAAAEAAGIPIANYGMVLAAANGIRANPATAEVRL